MPRPFKRSLVNKTDTITNSVNSSQIIQPSAGASEGEWLIWHFETKWKEIIDLEVINFEPEVYLAKVVQTITQLQPLLPFLPHTYPTPNFKTFINEILPALILHPSAHSYQTQLLNLVELLLLRVDTSDQVLNPENLTSLFGILPSPEYPNNLSKVYLKGNLLSVLENFLLTKSLNSEDDSFINFKPLLTHYTIQYIKFSSQLDRPPPHELFFSVDCLPASNFEVLVKNALECDKIPIQKFILDCLASSILQGYTLPLSIYPQILNLLHKHTINPSIHLNEELLKNLVFLLYSYGASYPTLITQSGINYELKQLGVPSLEKASPTFGIEIFKRLTHYLPRCWSVNVRKFGYLTLGSLGKLVFDFPDNAYLGEQLITQLDCLPPWKLSQSDLATIDGDAASKDFELNSNDLGGFDARKSVGHLDYLTSELNREFIDHRIQSNPDTARKTEDSEHHDSTTANNTNNEEESNSIEYLPTQGDHIISDVRTKVLSSKVTGGLGFGVEDVDHSVRISTLSSLSALAIFNPDLMPKVINFTLERLLDPVKLVSITALDCLLEIQLSSSYLLDTQFSQDRLITLVRSLSTSSDLLKEKIYELLASIKFTTLGSLDQFLRIFKSNLKLRGLKQVDKVLVNNALSQIGNKLTLKLDNLSTILDKHLINSNDSNTNNLNFPLDWNFGIYSLILNYLQNLQNNHKKLELWNQLSNFYKNGIIYAYNLKFKDKIFNLKASRISFDSNDDIKAIIKSPLPNTKELPKPIAYSIGADLTFNITFTNIKLNELRDIELQFKLSDNAPKLVNLTKLQGSEFKVLRTTNSAEFIANVKVGVPSIEGTFFIKFNLVNKRTGKFIGVCIRDDEGEVSGDGEFDDNGNANEVANNEDSSSWGIWLKYSDL